MTVCVAAICEASQSVIGASDRMLTAGNVQFQPPVSKCYALTSSAVLMVAGEMTIQAEIVAVMRDKLYAMLSIEPPPEWLRISEIAAMYSQVHSELRAKRAENEFLRPLGLSLETFLSRQTEMSSQLVSSLATEMITKAFPRVEAIIAGVDRTGAHIYVADGAMVSCHDAAGFAAIGNGWYHANSHLMFSRHGKNAGFTKTLWLTYSAKKRAEVAPGVGEDTDMFGVRGLGQHFEIGDHVLAEFDIVYGQMVELHAQADAESERKANESLTELLAARASVGAEEQQAVDPSPPADGAAASNDGDQTGTTGGS
ncbi:hypothetical protein ACSFBX_22815 [Variovorax sp. RB2P76]|uniref:hypothetical protein n=1 Tax=Variovorax sp. RB2P76 TaxID=3443736 RepID=UPI003F46BBF5